MFGKPAPASDWAAALLSPGPAFARRPGEPVDWLIGYAIWWSLLTTAAFALPLFLRRMLNFGVHPLLGSSLLFLLFLGGSALWLLLSSMLLRGAAGRAVEDEPYFQLCRLLGLTQAPLPLLLALLTSAVSPGGVGGRSGAAPAPLPPWVAQTAFIPAAAVLWSAALLGAALALQFRISPGRSAGLAILFIPVQAALWLLPLSLLIAGS